MANLSPAIVTATKYLAILCYTLWIGFALFTHMIIWKSLMKGQQWALWTITAAWGLMIAIVFMADVTIGGRWLVLNTPFHILFLCGIGVCGYGLFKQQRIETG